MKKLISIFLLGVLASCINIPKTLEHDKTLSSTTIDGYSYHTKIFGSKELPPLIVLHGGPGGSHDYLLPLKALSKSHQVIFYDQRGAGLSPRVDESQHTIEQNLGDLESFIDHFAGSGKVKVIGHSWGGMLGIAALATSGDKISHMVAIEPGVLTPESAAAFAEEMDKHTTIMDGLFLVGQILSSALVNSLDGHEKFDYVMTSMINRAKPGKPYQCDNEKIPEGSFSRGGFDSFDKMLRPIMSEPELFKYNLAKGAKKYRGKLLLISSSCSIIGYDYQEKYHTKLLPAHTHQLADKMGHNMVSLQPSWAIGTLAPFLSKR